MSQKTSEFEPAIRRLKRQAAESIHKDTDPLTVVRGFSFSDTPVSGMAVRGWEAKCGYRLMVCAFDCKELAGFTTTGLSEYLADAERACACTLGSDPEQFAPDKTVPDRTTFDHTWRDRFPDRLKSFITQSAQRILAVAHDIGNPLGMRALEPTDKTNCSNRTERRYVTESAKDMTDAFCQVVFSAIDLGRPDEGTRYGDTAFLDLQSYLELTGTAASQGSQMFDEETTREAGGPAGDTHLQYSTVQYSTVQYSTVYQATRRDGDRVDDQRRNW